MDFEVEKARSELSMGKSHLEERMVFEKAESDRRMNALNIEKNQELNEMFTDNKHLA